MENYRNILIKLKNYLKNKISSTLYNDLIKDITEIYKVENNIVYLKVDSELTKSRIESFLTQTIAEFLVENSFDVLIKFTTDEIIEKKAIEEIKEEKKQARLEHYSNLNSLYTFDNFVVGKTNRLAFNAAMKTADQPGMLANPLYIFGDVGIGKTHLMQSIGNYIVENDQSKKVLYIKTGDFIDDFLSSIKNQNKAENQKKFTEKYYNNDVLLIDDIQFLSKKEYTQAGFFNLFEKMISENKQIVITSDKPARELQGIAARLTSRFSMGMTFDIGLPELDHRIAILEKKVRMKTNNVNVPKEVLEYIALNFDKSVRDLEGALNRVLFCCIDLNNGEVTYETAKEALSGMISSSQKMKKIAQNSYKEIENTFEIVCDYYDVSKTDIMSTSRKKKIIYPRQMIMYILRYNYKLEYTKIGIIFNGKKHTTVMNSCDKIKNLIKSTSSVRSDYHNLCSKLGKNVQ